MGLLVRGPIPPLGIWRPPRALWDAGWGGHVAPPGGHGGVLLSRSSAVGWMGSL